MAFHGAGPVCGMAFVSAVLSRGEMRAALEVLGPASASRELPDPIRWADLLHASDATVAVLARRLDEGRSPRGGEVLRWPKEKGGYRPMAWLDPFDQLAYHGVVGRFAPAVAASIDYDHVLSTRVVGLAPRWQLEPYGKGLAERTKRGLLLLERHPLLGLLDIKSFFPSIRRPALESTLGALPLHGPSVEWLLDWLDSLDAMRGISGLPTGFDASHVLASALLVGCDTMLAELGVPFMRWVDDTWMFLNHPGHFRQLRDLYAERLAPLGLELHPDKSQPLIGLDALNEVKRTAISYVEDEVRGEGETSRAAARELFGFALEDLGARKSELRFALSALGRHRDPVPLDALRDEGDLLRYGPKHWVKYLRSMMGAGPSRKLVGDDWLVTQATAPVTKASGYQNLLYLQVAAGLHLSKDLGRRVFEVAKTEGGSNAPLRVWAAHVWGRSHAFKPNLAVEQVEERGDFSTRRAFALTLKPRRDDANMPKWLTRVRLADPELEPTATWLEAA